MQERAGAREPGYMDKRKKHGVCYYQWLWLPPPELLRPMFDMPRNIRIVLKGALSRMRY